MFRNAYLRGTNVLMTALRRSWVQSDRSNAALKRDVDFEDDNETVSASTHESKNTLGKKKKRHEMNQRMSERLRLK